MTTHPYLPLYVDDYEAATAHLSPAEDGVYSRLLRLCWRTPGCSLPNDHSWIARKIRMSAEDYSAFGQAVLNEFFSLQRGRFVQKRLKAEYDNISRKKSARVKAGKKGGAAKALKTLGIVPGNANDLPAHTRAFPEPYPEPEPEEDKSSVEAAKPRAPRGSKLVPDGWHVSQAHYGAGLELGFSVPDIDREAVKFRNYERKTAVTDWNRAFHNWLVRADEFRRERNPKAKRVGFV